MIKIVNVVFSRIGGEHELYRCACVHGGTFQLIKTQHTRYMYRYFKKMDFVT